MSKTLYKCGCQGGRFKWNQVTYGYCADCYDKIVKAAPAIYEALKEAHEALSEIPDWPDLEDDHMLDDQIDKALAEAKGE